MRAHYLAAYLASTVFMTGCTAVLGLEPGKPWCSLCHGDCAVLPSNAPNLAHKKPVVATSFQEDGNRAPSLAVDGDGYSYWSSAWQEDPQWIRVDLGATYDIIEVRLDWQDAYATAYSVEVSDDASTWQPIYSTTTGDGDVDDLSCPSTSARFVRMYGTKRKLTDFGYALLEFQVYRSE